MTAQSSTSEASEAVVKASKHAQWEGVLQEPSIEMLTKPGGLVVSATKVGYILIATDGAGLQRKFNAKQRSLTKPSVVLCADVEQVQALAQTNDEIMSFYERHWRDDILLGCILPWRPDALSRIPDDGSRGLVMDGRGTSCFVIRFGRPAEQLVSAAWDRGQLSFASSANPSGQGNRGRVANIGDRIENEADYVIAADDYVESIQPGKTAETRHEQGVMVSMVDAEGRLVPTQTGRRSVTPCPTMIRRGLDGERIMEHLADTFQSWDYRHGEYY